MAQPLKIMIYDQTPLLDGLNDATQDGLALSWKWGGKLYQMFHRFDLVISALSWEHAIEQILYKTQDCPIGEIQFWGHGWPGAAFVGSDRLDIYDFLEGHRSELANFLIQLSSQLDADSLVWFRTCATFCGAKGQAFAYHLSDLLGCTVAGHTHIIGPWQAGLHTLKPHQDPYWSVGEGIAEGTPSRVKKAKTSTPFTSPNGISCLTSKIPKGW